MRDYLEFGFVWIFRSFVFGFVLFFHVCRVVIADDAVLDKEFSDAKDVQLIDTFLRTRGAHPLIDVNLADSKPGDKCFVSVLLHNKAESALTLESVDLGCSCIQARVPKTTILPGYHERLDFVFRVAPHPTTLTETFDVGINATGASRKIDLRFLTRLVDHVGFKSREHVCKFTIAQPSVTFDVPLFVTDPTLVKDMVVRVSPDLEGLRASARLVSNAGFVHCEFDPRKLSDDIAGEIEILRNGKVVDSLVCFLQRVHELELLPNQMVFARNPDSEAGFTGTALLKIEQGVDKSVHEIRCETAMGNQISMEWKSVGKKMIRLTARVDDPIELGAKAGKLKLFVVDANAKVIRTEFAFSLSN